MSHPAAVPDETLEDWCRGARGGDSASLERLLWHWHGRLREHASRKIGPDFHGRLEPDDLLQEAYIDAVAGIGKFESRGGESFYHWMARIIDRRFIDHVRRLRAARRDIAREGRAAAGMTSSFQQLAALCAADATTPSQSLREDEARCAMMSAMARLPDDYRLVVRRIYLDGDALPTVAAEMQRTEDAVRRLAGRAVEQIRAQLRQWTTNVGIR